MKYAERTIRGHPEIYYKDYERGGPVIQKYTNTQVGIAMGPLGPCEMYENNTHHWCPDTFTNLTHPNINSFVNKVLGKFLDSNVFLFQTHSGPKKIA